MTEEMFYILLKKARDAYKKRAKGVEAECPFCRLAFLRKIRNGDVISARCEYCELDSPWIHCEDYGRMLLCQLEAKYAGRDVLYNA